MRVLTLTVAVQILFGLATAGYFFNDIKPKAYRKTKELPITVGQLASKSKMLKQEFYSLNYCDANKTLRHNATEAAEVVPTEIEDASNIFDTEVHNSFFKLQVAIDKVDPKQACVRSLDPQALEDYKQAIKDGMSYRLYLDGLPSATKISRTMVNNQVHTSYNMGLQVGIYMPAAAGIEEKFLLYNHWNILVKYQPVPESEKEFHIVGFEVEPRSYGNTMEQSKKPKWENAYHTTLDLNQLKN